MLDNSQFSANIHDNILGGELGTTDNTGEKVLIGVGYRTVTACSLEKSLKYIRNIFLSPVVFSWMRIELLSFFHNAQNKLKLKITIGSFLAHRQWLSFYL